MIPAGVDYENVILLPRGERFQCRTRRGRLNSEFRF
jgi:hypothetical protein